MIQIPGMKRPIRWIICLVIVLIFLLLSLNVAYAGPPFLTDDPDPGEYRHWEINLASQSSKGKEGTLATAPHFEINYVAIPDVQLHTTLPFSYNKPSGEKGHYGFGDIEFGIKYRFFQETSSFPQIGTFPLIEIPTGNQNLGLGGGHVRAFFPVWIMKTWGHWATFGGGGYWINPGSDNKNYWFIGWALQRDLSKWVTVGGESFHVTPSVRGEGGETGFNVGGFLNFSQEHHLLFSVGRDFHGLNRFLMYVGYQLTIGPPEK